MTADWLSAGATVATAIIAAAALYIAKTQVAQTRAIARESTATNLYNNCLELCLQYPKLAEPQLSGGFVKLVSDPNQGACYGWFVASLLLSCEEILEVTNNDNQWRASVSSTLDGHAEYFRFRNEGNLKLESFYSDKLMSIINSLIADASNPPEARAIQMSRLANA